MKNIIKGNFIENIALIIVGIYLLFLFIVTTIYQNSIYIIPTTIVAIIIIYHVIKLRYKIVFEENHLIIRKLKSKIINYNDVKRFELKKILATRKRKVVKVYIILNNDKEIEFTTINETENYKLRKILKQKRIKYWEE